MTYERLPQYFWSEDTLTRNKKMNIDRADLIIAISETTKNDLIAYSDVDPAKIKVIYHGIDLDEPLITKELPNLPQNYILFVGDRSGYKNFYLFLNAFAIISKKYPDLNVVLTGGGNVGISDVEYICRLKVQTKIKHINVSDEGLNLLYKNAIAFVYPSLHEGFGLPILEAFKAGCPVLLSNTDCFREIGTDAVAYFHPYHVEYLIEMLEKVITDTEFRTNLIAKGKIRLKDFPLDKSVKETLDVYKSLS
jgi:glycosyltransferase involved in cell wall biosynthesis